MTMLDENLAWLNSHVWLGAVHLTELPRRHPLPPRWQALAFGCAGAAVERGEHDDSKRERFCVTGDSLYEAVVLLVAEVKRTAIRLRVHLSSSLTPDFVACGITSQPWVKRTQQKAEATCPDCLALDAQADEVTR